MTKIGYFIDSSDPGGAETLLIEIASRVKEHRYDVEVFHFGNDWLERKCAERKITSTIVPGEMLYKSKYTLLAFCFFLGIYIRYKKIDILHSHLFDAVIASGISCFLSRIPHIGTLHDIFSFENNNGRAKILRYVKKLGSKIVVVSDLMKKHLQELTTFENGDLHVIHNGVELYDNNIKHKEQSRIEMSFPADAILFISVGRLVEIKAHEVLIEAFQILLKSYKNAYLLIVGDGPKYSELKKLVNDFEISSHVQFMGHRDDVPKLLELSDCFVLSSRSEGLSCSIIEAMSARLPIVATNVGGNYELIDNNQNGFLVEKDSPSDLAEKMSFFMEKNDMIDSFGIRSRKRVAQDFSINKTLGKYMELYEEVLS